MSAPVQERPLIQPQMANSPCGSPCDSPCDEPKESMLSGWSERWHRIQLSALYNAVDLAFDEVLKEPQKILMIGGCRQQDFAQHIALLLPAADITLVDPDAEIARAAKEKICCRFQFTSAPLNKLPFQTGEFDLVFAHNLLELSGDYAPVIDEISRVTTRNHGNFLISHHRPKAWRAMALLPGFEDAMNEIGTPSPLFAVSDNALETAIKQHADIAQKLSPLPWRIYMTAPLR